MSLPPGFLDELRTRVTLSSVVGRKVTWDMRKSNMAKGDFWAPCPFHQEKSASFHVDDRKGFYYCFGCHAKGDAVTFVKESENLGFMEAVELLAREAGMPMPARDARAAEKADHRTLLGQVVEEALKFYRLNLKASAGAEARRYLTDKRRLPEAAWERWELGWSPENAQATVEALKQKGISPELMVASGVIAKSDSGRLYDRFHNRLIFPIRDGRGRAISFGGRSLDPNARAKYLNGPETDLFDKGRNLFNHAPAREAAGKGLPLIVAEGYMDVIALAEAGFKAAVAPLGTAVTEDQLRLMWRISDEPVISLDGDKAGIRAALRVIDLALPLLEAGKGLRFAVLPEGQDPDDLIKAQGPGAMQKVLDQAQPMVRLLWNRETEGKVFDSPERKAALDKTLRAALKRIADPSIRGHYGEEIKALRATLFGTGARPFKEWQPRAPRQGGKFAPPVVIAPAASTRNSFLAGSDTNETFVLEATILAGMLMFPALIDEFESSLGPLRFSGPGHNRLLDCLLGLPQGVEAIEYARLHAAVELETLLSDRHVFSMPFMRPGYPQEGAMTIMADAVTKLRAVRGGVREVSEAAKDIEGLVDEGLTWRVSKTNEARFAAQRGPQDNTGEAVLAPNGVALDRNELEQSRKVFEGIRFEKPKGRH
ncbi:DNA primase [Fuscibacter oryzae]|uniref:DNA primase n=1 Tax=Fuscibacter oryzae TaxID=2803939 RepID=A0A8J7MTL3_9RHOB|nr:DNA primase [Fuscibacter oryzae]MBL4927169.1 DNA primase [Fuscibacter oryzae]